MLMDILSGKSDVTKMLQESDLFKFESNLGQRDINRQLKARGLYGSGAGLEALSRFSSELTAKEGQRHYDRLIGGYSEIMRQGTRRGQSSRGGVGRVGGGHERPRRAARGYCAASWCPGGSAINEIHIALSDP